MIRHAAVILAHYGFPVDGFGMFTATTVYSEDSGTASLRIDRADPRIMIARAVLEAVAAPSEDPSVDVAVFDPGPDDRDPCLGGLLHVYGLNRNVVYRVGDPVGAAGREGWPVAYAAELAPG